MAASTPSASTQPLPQRIVIERNPYGVADVVLGIVAFLIPFSTSLLVQPWSVVLLGPTAAGVAIWTGITGLRLSRKNTVGRNASSAGIATGATAVLGWFYVFANSWVLLG